MKNSRFLLLPLVLVAAVVAQQPNTGNHSMTINGIDGPPFPILTNNVRTSTNATITIAGASNQPYALFQAGQISTGSLNVLGGQFVDLSLTPPPVVVADGFAYPGAFQTDITGTGGFVVGVPNAGTPPNGVPLGAQLALQTLMGDPFNSPWGLSLTAATKITVVQGPTITFYSLGDDSNVAISVPAAMAIPFYGNNYTSFYIGSNGFLTFGSTAPVADYTPTPAEFQSGPPRIAGMWCDLSCPTNSVKTTVDANPGLGLPGYLRVDFINVVDLGLTVTHNFSMLVKSDGNVEIIQHPTQNASTYDHIVGIGPGNNLGGINQKNFVGAAPGGTVGPGLLTTPPYAYLGAVNEPFFEWFGIVSQNAYYTNGYNNPFDLYALTIHFTPQGSGTLPASTNRYIVY